MNESVSRKYIVVLALLAGAVLVAGALLKPKAPAPEQPSPSETASLQARVRREDLGDTASFFEKQAQTLAPSVVYDKPHNSSAVAWAQSGQAITTRSADAESLDPPLVLIRHNAGTPPFVRADNQQAGRWLLIVGRTADGQILWTPAVYGGTRQTTCAGETYRELTVNARLDSALSGAGAFDLDGLLVGLVANCDGSYHLISAASIPTLLTTFETAEKKIETTYGFHVGDLSAAAKSFFSVDAGLFVAEVRQGDAADRAGLNAGDLLTGLKGAPISNKQDLWRALESDDESARSLEVLRNHRKLTVKMPSLADAQRTRVADESLGIRILPAAVAESLYVAPGTPAYSAGLRTEDHLVQINERRSSAVAELSRAIAAMGDKPLLLVYQRGRVQRAALVTK